MVIQNQQKALEVVVASVTWNPEHLEEPLLVGYR